MDSIASTSSSPLHRDTMMMAWRNDKRKVLVIGPMNTFIKCIVEESIELGYPTSLLLHPPYPTTDPAVNAIVATLCENRIFSLLPGRIENHERLVQTISNVDVVMSTAGGDLMERHMEKIIAAMKEALNFARLIPLGILYDVDKIRALQPEDKEIERCRAMRRYIEVSGIRYTYVVTNFLAGEFLGRLNGEQSPLSVPLKIPLYGDGSTKVSFCFEKEAAIYINKAAHDLVTLRKTVYIRHPENVVSLDDLVSIWERKIHVPCERIYISEAALLKSYRDSNEPAEKTRLALIHSAFIMGDQTNFPVDPESGLEAPQLYRDVNYTKLDEYLNRFIAD